MSWPPRTFGLYVHLPWCRIRCPFCDFNVVAARRRPERREDEYVGALVREIGERASRPPWNALRLATVYVGGGTPSLCSAGSIGRILEAAASSFRLEEGAEVTLEANPEDAHPGHLRELARLGVNRLSFGIQSFHPHLLKRLGRLQTAGETRLAVPRAREAGFDNVSLDLMFAIPGETLPEWEGDLAEATAFAPEHVSAYALTWEEGTAFVDLRDRGKLAPAAEDVEAAMFETARERLAAAGYVAYEVSSFALPGRESRHNRSYWTGEPYLGVGAGAHSHLPDRTGATRWSNVRDPAAWAARVATDGTAVESEERLDTLTSAGETIFLALRTPEGVDRSAFRSRFGDSPEALFPAFAELVGDGLVVEEAGRLRLTPTGLRFGDLVAERFVLNRPAA